MPPSTLSFVAPVTAFILPVKPERVWLASHAKAAASTNWGAMPKSDVVDIVYSGNNDATRSTRKVFFVPPPHKKTSQACAALSILMLFDIVSAVNSVNVL